MQSSICFYTTKIILIARAQTRLSNCVIVSTGVCVCVYAHLYTPVSLRHSVHVRPSVNQRMFLNHF